MLSGRAPRPWGRARPRDMVTDGSLGQAYLLDISLMGYQCGRTIRFAAKLGERFGIGRLQQ